ncbi:MAG: DUF4221 family protein [Bacteroidota bacterium]|nr:DUF4221 family protein [Bacteroidota bacterium]
MTRDVSQNVPKIYDKGLDTIFLDKTVDFQGLGLLQVTQLKNQEYLSHFNHRTRGIYIYSLESGKLKRKVTLAREGPDQIVFPIAVDYFIHNFDSIFIDTQLNTYYLINDNAEIIKALGNRSKSFSAQDLSISFESASFFDGDMVHGSIRMPFNGTPKETVYSRASMRLEGDLDIKLSVKNRDFIKNYEEVLAYRKEEENGTGMLINLPRYFVRQGEFLYATTPVSDSIYVFKNGLLVEKFYAGVDGFEMATHIEFLNFTRTIRRPGEVIYEHETKRKAYYLKTLMDPAGQFIYRILIEGTHPVLNERGNDRIPELNGATLLAIDLSSQLISAFELPIDEILIERHSFASTKGVHFMVKEQNNEDHVLFRIIGMDNK